MKLEVLRISSQADSTSGILFDVTDNVRKFMCYTVEDEYRKTKVHGETRIPAGDYKLGLRKVGGFHTRYKSKYSSMHIGMIQVLDVPGFEFILLHPGNSDENTKGCLLMGQSQESNLIKPDGFVGSSVSAYKSIYPKIANAIASGVECTIKYVDYDGPFKDETKKVWKRPTRRPRYLA